MAEFSITTESLTLDEIEIFETLPHGSGIDGRWSVDKKKGYYKLRNGYHAMNEHGYYVGWAEFSVVIYKKNPEGFKFHFHGDRAQRLNKRYMLRDYLEDTIAYWISETFKKGKPNGKV